MKTLARMLMVAAVLIFVLSLPSLALAGPHHGGGHHHGGGGNHSVAEPASLVLLGAGIVSLGIYAKRNRAKK